MTESTDAGQQPQGTGPGAAGTDGDAGPGRGDAGTPPQDPQQPGGAEGAPGTDDGGDAPATDTVDYWKSEAGKWKDMSRKNEKRARENATAASRLAKLEDAGKTELQRATERADRAERERAEERAERHRLLAAATHSLGPDFVEYLGGGDEEEIFGRAETLSGHINAEVTKRVDAELERLGVRRAGTSGNGAPSAAAAASLALGRRPAESLRPGAMPASDGRTANDPNEAFRQLLSRGQ
ncbi:MAG: hypothetical protein FWE15_02105 [Actinomycetia bacterium]|nr:hypothetical protein [Actinomycetes bacterium]